jgi:hypothetical protein
MEADMSTKSSGASARGAASGTKVAAKRKVRFGAAGAEYMSSVSPYQEVRIRVAKPGLRTRPKTKVMGKAKAAMASSRPAIERAYEYELGTVSVRLDPGSGSDALKELLTMTVAATADQFAKLGDDEQSEILANVRGRLATESGQTAASTVVLDALRRAGLFGGPIDEASSDHKNGDPADPDDDVQIPAGNRAALDRAFARAEENKVEILRRRDMLKGEEIAKRMGVARATPDNQRRTGRLLALELGTKRGLRYPAWQCELVVDVDTRAAFESVLEALAGSGPWSRYRFFVTPAAALGGRTPVEALKAGEGDAVRRAAETWAAGEQGGH